MTEAIHCYPDSQSAAICKFCGTSAMPNDERNCSSLEEAWQQTPARPYGCPWFDKDARKLYPRAAQSAAQVSELDDASNACLELAAKHGYATGHGDTVADMIREFSAQIPLPAVAQTAWMPIETAPKDGTDILVSCGPQHPTRLAFWDAARNNCWSVWPGRAFIEPLYWTPLPALSVPSAQSNSGGDDAGTR